MWFCYHINTTDFSSFILVNHRGCPQTQNAKILDKNCQWSIINQWKVTDSSRMNMRLEVLRTCICVAISKSKSNGVFKIPQLPIINTRVRSSLCIIILRSLKRKSWSCNNKLHVGIYNKILYDPFSLKDIQKCLFEIIHNLHDLMHFFTLVS